MYNEDELVRIKSVDKKLDSIFKIVERHGGVVNALDDLEGQPAILMLLVAISEQFSKLNKNSSSIIDLFEKDDIKGLISVRNYIEHDYDGINLSIVEMDIRENLPNIHKIVKNIIEKGNK